MEISVRATSEELRKVLELDDILNAGNNIEKIESVLGCELSLISWDVESSIKNKSLDSQIHYLIFSDK